MKTRTYIHACMYVIESTAGKLAFDSFRFKPYFSWVKNEVKIVLM